LKYNIFNPIISWVIKKRISRINKFIHEPIKSQENLLIKLIRKSENTIWGKKNNYKKIKNYENFKKNVPIQNYEDIKCYLELIKSGKENVLWPSKIISFAKSSGTTNDKSKLIPLTKESLKKCHLTAGKDLLSIYVNQFPKTKIFSGKSLMIGGSNEIEKNTKILTGDLSSILIENLPIWAQIISTPQKKIALMANWEEKLEKMVSKIINQDIRSISGVPSWTIILLERILEKSGKKKIIDIWPNLELFMHGGISISPYMKSFENLIGKKINYLEIYNASEGFFALQNDFKKNDLLLMLDYGVFYEFIPTNNNNSSKIIPLGMVKKNTNYEVVISTNGGLWRYKIGDTIKFTSVKPYKILITGRTKHYINYFGEELMVHNTDAAINKTSKQTNSVVNEYTVAPKFFSNNSGCHEWIIEFNLPPQNLEEFINILDENLKKVNSDYEAKRQGNLLLKKPIIHIAKKHFFYKWLKTKNKLGGQNKVPRLSNDRNNIEKLLQFL